MIAYIMAMCVGPIANRLALAPQKGIEDSVLMCFHVFGIMIHAICVYTCRSLLSNWKDAKMWRQAKAQADAEQKAKKDPASGDKKED